MDPRAPRRAEPAVPRSVLRRLALLPLVLVAAAGSVGASSDPRTGEPARPEPVDRVDPFIGTGGHGHTFPGATVPFGMVQLSPDTRLEGWDGCSGYHYSDDRVFGFSHTHLSGTGVSDYGDVLLFPCFDAGSMRSGWYAEDGYGSRFSKATETASPGYYAVTLEDSGVRVELTATARAGLHRYGFPANGREPGVLLDLAHRDEVLDSSLHLVGPNEVEGFRISKAWAVDQRVYFVARFSRPWTRIEVPSWDGGGGRRVSSEAAQAANAGPRSSRSVGTDAIRGTEIVRVIRFAPGDEPLLVKVGISPVSVENARRNLDEEIPAWDFDQVRAQARATWNEALSRIEIEGGTKDEETIFYTAFYHTLLQPNLFTDVNGEYRGHDGKTHHVSEGDGGRQSDRHGGTGRARQVGTDRPAAETLDAASWGRPGSKRPTYPLQYTVFSLWDTFRAAHPLYTILEPTRTVDFIHSMLRQYEQSGLLPVWELAGNETMCMIGYHSVSVIADAYAKGIRGFDAERALEAMQGSAQQDHLGLAEYRRYGYVPGDLESESVSKTLEYAYDDWCIAQLADALGSGSVRDEYLYRAQSWKNVLDPETGFMRAKIGSRWKTPFLPTDVDFHFTEANSWQYSFFVPQDVSGLMEALGGKAEFVARLDGLFSASSETTGRKQADITGLIGQYAHGNEPSHHMAYLYAYADQPWKTQERVHEILTTLYRAAPDGLAGNEDCGQMSAWYLLSALGFYPVTPGQDSYVLGAPLFERATIHLEDGKRFRIVRSEQPPHRSHRVHDRSSATDVALSGPGIKRAAGRGSEGRTPRYVRSASLNGEPITRSFLRHDEIVSGGELRFEVGSEPSRSWGVGPGNVPVSRMDAGGFVPVPYVAEGPLTFREPIDVVLAHPRPGDAPIVYTRDGSEPTPSSTRYVEPIRLDGSASLRFATAHVERRPGQARAETIGLVQEATFQRIDGSRSLVATSPPSPTYPGGGPEALIDGLRGGPDFRLGTWQGFEGKDLEATVDLGEVTTLKRLALGCLQDENSWIFFPGSVEFEVSLDGRRFDPVGAASSGVDPREPGGLLREIAVSLDGIEARFVRVHARSLRICPSWHKGAGSPCWIFVDEILVE